MSSSISHIVLLGLMGVGKTTVGRRLAETLGWPHSDSDEAIAQTQGASVRELDHRVGTEGMHHLEAEQLLEALRQADPSVISAAASVVDDPDCRRALEDDDVYAVWLQGLPETLAERFAAQPHRPVFDPDTDSVLRRQLSDRGRWFAEAASRRVRVDGRTPQEIVEEILTGIDSETVRPRR